MSAKRDFLAVLAAGCVVLGMTTARAEQQTQTDRPTASASSQVAILPAPQLRARDARAPLLKTNTLQADPRWPRLKECIDKTEGSQAFRTCLQNVFGDMAGEQPRP